MSSSPAKNNSLTEPSSGPLDIMRSASPSSEASTGRSADGLQQGAGQRLGRPPPPDLVNLDRLEKKKNREKRRRSEVNERFNELVEVMDNAQSQMMNTPGYSNEFSKSILTKSDLLEKAVDLVKALADENKKLKMMVQGSIPPMPMMGHGHSVPFDPTHVYQGWAAAPQQQMPPFGAPVLYPAQSAQQQVRGGVPPEYQHQFMRPHAQHMIPPALNKPSVLSYADMAQLGDWGAVNGHNAFETQQKTRFETTPVSKTSNVTFQPTHAECA